MKPLVIDIYHGDPVNDFGAVKNFGIIGVIHKCTEAQRYVDSSYVGRRKAFTDIGLKWGAYHFFHGDGKGEADYFLSHADPDQTTLLALDWETTLQGYTPTADQAKVFIERIAEKTGQKPVIYSGHAAKEKIHGKDAFFGSHRLWLAQYASQWSCQASWQKPWLWQNNGDNYGPGPHHIPGVSGYCDNNTIVEGTAEDLIASWTGGDKTPTPEPVPVDPKPTWSQSGIASWYTDGTNADGSPVHNATDLTAAHKTLPFGTAVKVTRQDTGHSVTVTIRDRGPFVANRIIDLRPYPAELLKMKDAGIVPVRIEVVSREEHKDWRRI